MDDEISNKTLATLLVIAIVICLAGTFFSMKITPQILEIRNAINQAKEAYEAPILCSNVEGQEVINMSLCEKLTKTDVDTELIDEYPFVKIKTQCLTTPITEGDKNTCYVLRRDE